MNEAAVGAVLATLMPVWRWDEVRSIEYLPGGYTNRNYKVEVRGSAYALRVVEGSAPRPHERRYLDIDASPDVVAYDSERGHLLTRWIDGPLLAASPPEPAEAGVYLAALHASIPLGVRRYEDFSGEIMKVQCRHGQIDRDRRGRPRPARQLH